MPSSAAADTAELAHQRDRIRYGGRVLLGPFRGTVVGGDDNGELGLCAGRGDGRVG